MSKVISIENVGLTWLVKIERSQNAFIKQENYSDIIKTFVVGGNLYLADNQKVLTSRSYLHPSKIVEGDNIKGE
jgi:hypothetical protein